MTVLQHAGDDPGKLDVAHEAMRAASPQPTPLEAASTGLTIPAAISFTLFAQPVLIEASFSQFATHIAPGWSLAGLAVSAAIPFAPLSQRILVFAGAPQFLALPASEPDASRSDLNGLGEGRNRKQKKSCCRRHADSIIAHTLDHPWLLHVVHWIHHAGGEHLFPAKRRSFDAGRPNGDGT